MRVETLATQLDAMFQDKINGFFKRFNATLDEKLDRSDAQVMLLKKVNKGEFE